MASRRHHDMGGLIAEKADNKEHNYEMWEKKTDAIIKLLSDEDCQLLSTDELRRGIEELGPGVYDKLSYYERWITSATNILLEKGILKVHDLGVKMADVEQRWAKDYEQRK